MSIIYTTKFHFPRLSIYKIFKSILYILPVSLICTTLHAQGLKFKNISFDPGLSQSKIISIIQEHKEYMWYVKKVGLNQNKYKFEGLDKEWNNIDNRRFTPNTNLHPGKCFFKIIGSNIDGNWNKKESSILLNIQPPFWLNNWFILVVVFILIAIIYTLYLTNIRNIKKRNTQLEDINKNLNNEIKERKRVEEELRDQKQILVDVFNGVQEGIGFVDKFENIEYCNKAFADIFEYSIDSLIGKNLLDIFPEKAQKIILEQTQKRKKGEISSYELTYITPGGEKKYMRVTISPRINTEKEFIGAIGAILDITSQVVAEEKRSFIEAQLRQSQKMETIGTLAGGIAHDFNNILVPIIGYTEMSLELLTDNEQVKSNLEKILKASTRAKGLITQILTFSRQDKKGLENIEIHILIKEALKLLRSSLPSTIEIRQDIDENCGTILADPTQIQQVLMNLCTNAYHAMREKGGILEIKLTLINIDEKTAAQHKGFQSGKSYVLLSVKDTGKGMDETIKERIFEPFFTTKKVGEGTGLGLAAVHGIVLSHGGKITVESQPGKGSTFNVYLPQTNIKNDKSVKIINNPLPKGHEHILFIDDEKDIVSLYKQILENLGYKVTAKTDSLETVKEFKKNSEIYDLVITDQTMPYMTGVELAREILTIRPDIPIILCTGYSETISQEKAKEIGIKDFIMKPLTMTTIASSIRKFLDNHDDSLT